MALSYDDLRTLSLLASEQADNRGLSMPDRERWADIAERVIESSGTANDLRECAKLAEVDAGLQGDAKVRQRYLALAARALAET